MILTRTPLRISLLGGGTDMPAFFNNQFGAVVSFAINKYVYVGVNKKFDGRTRLSYSKVEEVDSDDLKYLQHDIAREILKIEGMRGVEITSISDIPGSGTGLGSSSAYALGLTLALRVYKMLRTNLHPSILADHAYRVERQYCGHPVGKQDHYAAAYGGLHYFQFNEDDSVTAQLLRLNDNQVHWLEETLMLFYTGRSRSSDIILKDQEDNLARGAGAYEAAMKLRDMAVQLRDDLADDNIDNIGAYLHEAWEEKKRLSGGVSMHFIDEAYERALGAGAIGGKICGAGGGGFMVLAVKQGRQLDVEQALAGWPRVYWKMDTRGSQVVYNGGQDE